jgi:flagellar hook-associated protein 3 FlgL
MTRISENQVARALLADIADNRGRVNRFSREVSTGLKAIDPGDSKFAGTIAQYRETLDRIAGHKQRVETVKATLAFQDNVLTQVNDILVRGRELATQAANETVGPEVRSQMSREVFELRDHLVTLANSKNQGKYVFAGTDDDDAPYGQAAYALPLTGDAGERWIYDDTTVNADLGNADSRSVNVTDDLSIVVSKPGSSIFSNGIYALERLGRALAGYETLPASGQPDGTGAAYSLPTDTGRQTAAIQDAITLLTNAREQDVIPERVGVGASLRRLDTASSLLDLTETDAKEALAKLQEADIAESGSNLQQAQTALEVSYTITSRLLNLSILDYL